MSGRMSPTASQFVRTDDLRVAAIEDGGRDLP